VADGPRLKARLLAVFSLFAVARLQALTLQPGFLNPRTLAPAAAQHPAAEEDASATASPPAGAEVQAGKDDLAALLLEDVGDALAWQAALNWQSLGAESPFQGLGIREFEAGKAARVRLQDGFLPLSDFARGRGGSILWHTLSSHEVSGLRTFLGALDPGAGGDRLGGKVLFDSVRPATTRWEADGAYLLQDFDLLGSQGSLEGWRSHLGLAGLWAGIGYSVLYDHLSNQSQPLDFFSSTQFSSSSGQPAVTGTLKDQDPRGADRLFYGTEGPRSLQEDLAKAHLYFDLGQALKVEALTSSLWQQSSQMDAKDYLRDAAGKTVWGDGVTSTADASAGGSAFSVEPGLFGLSQSQVNLLLAGLRLRGQWNESWAYEAAAGTYAPQSGQVRRSNRNPADPAYDGSGLVQETEGGGWRWAEASLKDDHLGVPGLTARAGTELTTAGLRENFYASKDWQAGDKAVWLSSSGGQTQTLASWAQVEWRLGGASLELGTRYEDWMALDGVQEVPGTFTAFPVLHDSALSPKASLVLGGEGSEARLSLGRATRFPSVDELFLQESTPRQVWAGDPGLNPETALQASLAFSQKASLADWTLNLFRDDIRKMIFYDGTAGTFPASASPMNLDRVLAQGAEFGLHPKPWLAGKLDTRASVSWVDARILEETDFSALVGNVLPRVPMLRASLVGRYQATETAAFSLGGRWTSSQFNDLDNEDTHAATYGGYSQVLIVDAKADFTLPHGLEFQAGVGNLFDAQVYAVSPLPQRHYFVEAGGAF
jgi:iron complex outermembrane receptor protein